MKNSRIYIGTIIVSLGLILFSFIPHGWKIWENILVSIGCSGIAAAVMAIFLEMHDERKEEKRRKELRQTFLVELDSELRHLFERVLWFEGVLDKIDLSKEIEHYTSINFIKKRILLNIIARRSWLIVKARLLEFVRSIRKNQFMRWTRNQYQRLKRCF